jgi:hypothetical protein
VAALLLKFAGTDRSDMLNAEDEFSTTTPFLATILL